MCVAMPYYCFISHIADLINVYVTTGTSFISLEKCIFKYFDNFLIGFFVICVELRRFDHT